MAKITPLFSSSKGNSYLIEEGSDKLLIDCGVSTKQLCLALDALEINPSSISGILLTHEHIDHIKGVKVFTKKFNTPLYATEAVLSYMMARDTLHFGNPLIPLSAVGNQVGDFWVENFETPHDSVGSVGFRITTDLEKTLGFVTDFGAVTDCIKEGLKGANCSVIEANYDLYMLKNGDYPYDTKRRIASTMGHSDNNDTAKLASFCMENGTDRFLLGHLSEENNLPSLAKLSFINELEKNNFSEKDFRLMVSKAQGDKNGIVF